MGRKQNGRKDPELVIENAGSWREEEGTDGAGSLDGVSGEGVVDEGDGSSKGGSSKGGASRGGSSKGGSSNGGSSRGGSSKGGSSRGGSSDGDSSDGGSSEGGSEGGRVSGAPGTTALACSSVLEEGAGGRQFSILEILGGGLLGHEFFSRNWGVIALVLFLTLCYVGNRYSADQELIRINDLQRELEEVRYRALTHNSELTMLCRQSNIEAALRAHGDSTLCASKEPPYVINRVKGK